jgi:putative ABC transport system substrate-binding protein
LPALALPGTNRRYTLNVNDKKGAFTMKKFVAVLSAAAMLATLAACGSTATTSTAASSADTAAASSSEAAAADDTAKSYKIAVVQQLDHASLDEIRTAVEAELDAKAAEKGITIEYKDFNGQNDATTLNQIGTQVVSDGYDAVVPIATLAAQCMANACAEDQIPVVYAAISDPAAADLTGLDYVTGTSDALNTQFILDMMLAINPDVKTVGLLYSNSEANSTTPIAEAKAYLDEKGIAYVEGTGNTNDEIMSAAANMVGKADAVFTPTDNVVMAAAAAVSETLTEAGIPFYTGADSFVTAGAFATCGVNYTELGTYTADMVLDILESGNVPEYHVMDGGIITVNTETAAALGIDYAAFSDMASQVVEVTTQQ